jgi:hypothetical protein
MLQQTTRTFDMILSPFHYDSNGSAGDPARVYRDRVHWSRWDIIFIDF